MGTIQEISEMVGNGNYKQAMLSLDKYIEDNPNDDYGYFTRGNLYVKIGDMPKAINDYCQAKELNPNSQAHKAYDALQEILNFYNTDLYNP